VSIDEWKEKQVENMVRWGNKRANEYWEALVPEDYYIPDENDPIGQVERWIREKYEKGKFKSKSKPKCLDASIDLSVSIPQIIAQAQGSSGKTGSSDKKEKKSSEGGAAKVVPPSSKGTTGSGAAAGGNAPPSSDPFDLLGFDAFPVTPKPSTVVSSVSGGAIDLDFFSVAQGPKAPAAEFPLPVAAPPPASNKAADIMALFGSTPSIQPNPTQVQDPFSFAAPAQAPSTAIDPFSTFSLSNALPMQQKPQETNPFSQFG